MNLSYLFSNLWTPKLRKILVVVGVSLVVLFVFKGLIFFFIKFFILLALLAFLAYTGWRYLGRRSD